MDTQDDDDPDETSGERPPTGPEQRLAAAVRADLIPGLAPPRTVSGRAPASTVSRGESVQDRIGRFAVLRELGRGGMGVVFVCYDEQLDRKVAVKLLRARYRDELARRRLEREAQALAKLSHPNVVQIYEFGDHHGDLFVAMEFVEGSTLRGWLAHDHDWRDTAMILRQAGAGLAAAHAAALVHRDFKPDNVMVGADERVRVLDFGLVRLATTESLTATEDSAQPDASTVVELVGDASLTATGLSALTRVGTVMGTPAYMAPEQFEAQPCDAASDQFSFCVVAFEGLFGRRPFRGDTLKRLSTAVRRGVPVALPDGSPVPKRLRAAIIRGLATAPAERWRDMGELLAEFDAVLDPGRRSRRLAWTFGAAALLIGAGAVGVSASSERAPMCMFDESALLIGIWDDDGRRALRAALAGREQVFADATFEAVDATLGDWGGRWLDGQRRACEATRVLGSQSEAMLDLRTSCLERQRRATAGIVEVLTSAEGAKLGHAFELLEQLPDLDVCDDPRLAEISHPMPTDPARREAIWAVGERISRARALSSASRVDEADALVDTIEARAPTLDHLPLTIEARALVAERSLWRRRVDEAVPILREAIREAEVAGLDELSATLRTRLAVHVVGQWGRPELQEAALEEAETALDRIGRPGDPRAIDLELARATLLASRGDYEAALDAYREGIARAGERGALGSVGHGQRQMARVLVGMQRFEEAERAYADARASFERAWGTSSTWSGADIELDLGLLDMARGRFDAAQRRLDSAREDFAPLLDPDVTTLDVLELAEAKLALMHGDLERASHSFTKVANNAADDLRRADAWEGLGVIRFYQGDMSGSLDAYRRALPYRLATRGPEHPSVGILYSNMGESLAASGDHTGAQAAFANALRILERALPPDHRDLAFPYKGRAQLWLALGETEAAVLDLERVLSLHEANPGEPIEHADVEFTLARALAETGARERARTLAANARRRLEELGHAELAAAVESWIHEHE